MDAKAAFIEELLDAVKLEVKVVRDAQQEKSLRKASKVLQELRSDLLNSEGRSDLVGLQKVRDRIALHYHACQPEHTGPADPRFESVVLGCTVDDQKQLRREFESLLKAAEDAVEKAQQEPPAEPMDQVSDDEDEEDYQGAAGVAMNAPPLGNGGDGEGEEGDGISGAEPEPAAFHPFRANANAAPPPPRSGWPPLRGTASPATAPPSPSEPPPTPAFLEPSPPHQHFHHARAGPTPAEASRAARRRRPLRPNIWGDAEDGGLDWGWPLRAPVATAPAARTGRRQPRPPPGFFEGYPGWGGGWRDFW